MIEVKETKEIIPSDIIELYKANKWSSAEKPEVLIPALLNSHSLVTAWYEEKIIGLGNAISDGFLVVYYPHLLVHPKFQGKGIGKLIIDRLQEKYTNFHQQILVADGESISFYQKCGFALAGDTKSMWIYKGGDH